MIYIDRIATDGTPHRITIGAHEIVADMSIADGGEGPDPHDLYDAALGACKALTMLWYAQRKGIALENIHVGIARDRSEEPNGVYKLTARIAIDGPMSDAERAKLIDVAGKCPIHRLMTQLETQIETLEIRPATSG